MTRNTESEELSLREAVARSTEPYGKQSIAGIYVQHPRKPGEDPTMIEIVVHSGDATLGDRPSVFADDERVVIEREATDDLRIPVTMHGDCYGPRTYDHRSGTPIFLVGSLQLKEGLARLRQKLRENTGDEEDFLDATSSD